MREHAHTEHLIKPEQERRDNQSAKCQQFTCGHASLEHCLRSAYVAGMAYVAARLAVKPIEE